MIITRTSCHFLTMATMNKHRHYSNKDVQLTVPSGFARRRGEIQGGLVFLTFVYGVTYYLLRDSVSIYMWLLKRGMRAVCVLSWTYELKWDTRMVFRSYPQCLPYKTNSFPHLKIQHTHRAHFSNQRRNSVSIMMTKNLVLDPTWSLFKRRHKSCNSSWASLALSLGM